MKNKYSEQFRKHFEELDSFIVAVLKSHLIMESAIDNIIRTIFFHPDTILDARINFFWKVEIIRAYAIRENEMSIWKLMLAISELRNEVAHNLEGEKRAKRMERVRTLYLTEVSEELAKRHEPYPDELIVVLASSLCTGFLSKLEKDIGHLRKAIDRMATERGLMDSDGAPQKKPKKGFN